MRPTGYPDGVLFRVYDSTPCSAAETSFRELDDAFVQTQTRIWLGEVLHMRFDKETTVADLLSDGELLFQVSRVVWKMLLKKYRELEHSKIHIYERTSSGKSGGRYMPYPKVDSFLKICQILGLTGIDLFSPSDVVDKRDTRRVCMCIRSLSKKARLKDLSVPDFDIVTYTIAMSTDMVGCIRRNLERSQSSSSSSSVCSSYMDLRELYGQKYVSSYTAWKHDSCSESDDAESAFRELDIQSPESFTSYDSGNLSGLIDGHSPGENSVVNDNFDLSQNLFKLDPIDLDNEDKMPIGVETFLAGSNDSCPLDTINYGNYQVTMNHTGSLPSSREVQTDLHGGINNPSSTPETIILIHDSDCLQPHVSSTGDLSSKLDLPFIVDAKEALNGKTCDCIMLCKGSFRSCSSKHTVLHNSRNTAYVNEDYTEASMALSGSERVERGRLLLEEIDNEGCNYMLELNDRKPKCGETTLFSDMLCESSPPDASLGDTEGMTMLGEHNVLETHAGDNVELNTSVRSYICLQSGASDSIFQNINSNFTAFSGNDVVDDVPSVPVETLHLKTGDSGYDSRSKSFNEVRGTELSLTDSLNYFSGHAATLACEGCLNACNICSNGSRIQFPDIHYLEQKKQGSITPEMSIKKLSKDSVEFAVLTSELPDMDLNKNTRDLASSKKDANVGSANLDESSPSARESLDAFKLDSPIYHSDPGTDSNLENKDNDSTQYFSSTTKLQACSQGIQNHGCRIASKCEKVPSPNKMTSDNTAVSTDAEEQYTSINGHPDIFSQMNVALKGGEHKTAEKLDIGGRKSSSCIMGYLENESVNGCYNKFENHPVAWALDPIKEGKVNNMLVSPSPHSCTTCDMPIGVKQDCYKVPCAEDHGFSGFVVSGPGESIDCTDRSEVGIRICSEPTKMYPKNLSCNWSSDTDKSRILHGILLGIDQHDLLSEGHAKKTPLFIDISDQGLMQETDSNVPDSKFLLHKADGIASVDRLVHSVDPIKTHSLQIGGMEIPLIFRTASSSSGDLNVADVSSIDHAPSPDCASLVKSVADIVHSGSLPSISSSLLSKSGISQTVESLSFSTSQISGWNSNAEEKIIGLEDHCQPLVDEDEACMNNNVVDSAGEPNESERREMDLKSTLSKNGREHKPVKNILLKSFASGVTLLGTLFLLHHLRKRRGAEILRKTVGQLQGQKRKQQAPAQKRVELGKVDVFYPGDRFKF